MIHQRDIATDCKSKNQLLVSGRLRHKPPATCRLTCMYCTCMARCLLLSITPSDSRRSPGRRPGWPGLGTAYGWTQSSSHCWWNFEVNKRTGLYFALGRKATTFLKQGKCLVVFGSENASAIKKQNVNQTDETIRYFLHFSYTAVA